jgi:type II secretory pathway component GspD/PulD (secretin)
MNIHHQGSAQRALQRASALIALLLACPLLVLAAHAQATPAASNSAAEQDAAGSYQTLYLSQKLQFGDANEVVTDLRNMIPKAKIYYVSSANAISVRGTPEEIAFAQRLVADLDRPRKMYRLTYTITDSEPGKSPSTQHISIIALTGVKTVFKQGRRVPLVTGDVKPTGSSPSTQVQYVDVGLNIEATIASSLQSVQMISRVEQTSIADEVSGIGAQDPIIHQTKLDHASEIVPGKPLALASLDIPGTTRREEIEVVAELVP